MSLAQEHCEATVPKLTDTEAEALLAQLSGWSIESGKLVKTFRFKDYYQTLAFVNASAFVSHREDHHPELLVTYDRVRVAYDTHSVDGLSRNDFICAARLDAL
ncbi:4a-hydroxytetrahydrobiopterin dehydratase [Chitinimonas lacunae]|uniref:Putative pterin-4-alpha-carbinolamine dehydratase n=1 Tax=Chitinimonas lacunae TaxID=1963018 RepID=A0ABV8MQC9_9NEIS